MSDRRVALVTGANKGIGLETVRQLAKQGVHVVLASRDAGKGESAAKSLAAEGLQVESLQLDVTDSASIARAASEIEKRHGHLDILVNNAGIFVEKLDRKPSEQTIESWRQTFDANVFGLIEVTQAFLPLLRKSKSARIVNVSSRLGSITDQADPNSPYFDFKVPAYNVSKSAVNAWTVQLAHELRGSRIKVNTIHPGHVKTDMGGANAAMEIVDGARTSVELSLIPDDGPNGGYFHLGERLPW
ncbi:MAG: short-chain dehydrogenase [Panacagrimonas sp.]|jgi:NAD(P)-dependent dehydrogenase (short-subunit alcohol dehydrogenase family)|nr:short-chain dehydrogenase [Panacagrimonas sp.]